MSNASAPELVGSVEPLRVRPRTRIRARSCPPTVGVGNLADAWAFLDELKDRYRHEPACWDEFVRIMMLFIDGHATVRETYHSVVELLRGQPDLIKAFEQFLPASMERMGAHNFFRRN